MDKKIRPIHTLSPRDSTQIERYTPNKRDGYFMQMKRKEKAGIAVLIPDKINFKPRLW